MNLVDYEALKREIVGASIPRPQPRELSGHTVGSVFEEVVYDKIKSYLPLNTFRQYEYLNYLRINTFRFNSYSEEFLLKRSKEATDTWDNNHLFEEKQNDTADMLVVWNGFSEIIDVKTKREFTGGGRPPNIISSYKLAQACAIMLDYNEFNKFTINYFEIDWEEQVNKLVCIDARVVNLFKANPESLYINWTAGKQIQVSLFSLEQNFIGTQKDWAIRYLKYFTTKFKENEIKQRNKFLTPFERYI